MNQILTELYERKSVRAYQERPIEEEQKGAVIKAALQAPSAGNMALYSIIDVTDQTLKEKLSITCDNQPFIAKAPMVLVFCADYHKWYELFDSYVEQVRKPGLGDLMLACDDTLIAAQNAVVAAQSLGIGSCYIGDIMERYEIHKELFHLPAYVVPIAMVVFGYPTTQQQERVKPARLRPEAVVFENVYRSMDASQYAEELKLRQDHEGEDFERWLKAFCKRKWNSGFSVEMSRSVKVMMDDWVEPSVMPGQGENEEKSDEFTGTI